MAVNSRFTGSASHESSSSINRKKLDHQPLIPGPTLLSLEADTVSLQESE